jgi:hypothetical protein
MLPNLSLLEQVRWKIRNTPNKQGEYKRKTHYCCYLLCEKAGLRVSEAINFNLNTKTRKGLYLLNKTKGRKKRFVYIPQKVINELKKHHWKPNSTNRFNFYHFLKRIKQELRISTSTELTPHTLRRAFATYHAESGLPLPLLSKLLGHQSVRTTALYWMNIYHGGDDDDDSNVGTVFAGKTWLENPQKSQPESLAPANLNLGELPELLIPNLLVREQQPNYSGEIHQLESQLSQICQENNALKTELTQEREQNANLRQDLNNLYQQNSYEITQREQVQQELSESKQIIKQLTQDLANEQEKHTITENNLSQEKALLFIQRQASHSLRQQLQAEREINTNLTQKLYVYEQNYLNLQNAYQNAIKSKQKAEEKLNNLLATIKTAAKQFQQWQKLNYYKQLEKQNEPKSQIIQSERPPPFKLYK